MKKLIIALTLGIVLTGCEAKELEVQTEVDNGGEAIVQTESIQINEQENEVDDIQVANEEMQELEEVEEEVTLAPNLVFQYIDTNQDERVEKVVNQAYKKFIDDFEVSFDEEITFIVYKDQPAFWEGAFGGENNGNTTGFADHEERVVHLTSPSDTSIKTEEEMLKIPVHELVHIILPHGYIDIREGIACYLAGQSMEFTLEDIPSNLSSIVTYQGGGDTIRMQYNLAGYKAKFMIEECFDMDFVKYKEYMNSPDDYSIAGYASEEEFLNDFRIYLQEKAI